MMMANVSSSSYNSCATLLPPPTNRSSANSSSLFFDLNKINYSSNVVAVSIKHRSDLRVMSSMRPPFRVDLEDQWDYDEHLEMNVEGIRKQLFTMLGKREKGF
ncbi:hypothetical protein Tco_1309117 [Tanacetum coccineum]